MFTFVQLIPLISLTVTLLVFCVLMSCLMIRPSAWRTILLTTPLKEQGTKERKKKPSKQDNVNPIYMWMVQPKEETGLKEGKTKNLTCGLIFVNNDLTIILVKSRIKQNCYSNN